MHNTQTKEAVETYEGVFAIDTHDFDDTAEDCSRRLLAAMAEHLGADALDAAAMQVQRSQTSTAHYRVERDLVWRLSDRLDRANADLSHYEQGTLPAAREYRARQALIASLRDDVASLENELRGNSPPIQRLPDGTYFVDIVDASLQPEQGARHATALEIHYAALQGAERGRRFTRRVLVDATSSELEEQGQRKLRGIKAACGITGVLDDVTDLKKHPHWISVHNGKVVLEGLAAAPGVAP